MAFVCTMSNKITSVSSRTGYLTLLLVLGVGIRSSTAQVLESSGSISLHLEWSVGGDESAEAEYLFGRPNWAAATSTGGVAVSDAMSLDIRLFGPEGTHLSTLGARGDAPGEFQAVTSFTVDSLDRVIVLDGRLSRMTIFGPAASEVSTASISRDELLWPRRVQSSGDGRLQALARMPTHARRAQEAVANLLHSLDVTSARVVGRSVQFTTPYTESSSLDAQLFETLLQSHPGSMVLMGDHACVAPGLYSGRIICSDARFQGDQSRPALPEPVRAVDCDADSETGLIRILRRTEPRRLCGYIQVQSAGLFALSTAELLHFYFVSDTSGGELRYEIIGAGGRLVETGVFSRSWPKAWHTQPPILLATSTGRHIYAIDSSPPSPTVSKYLLVRD